MQCQRAGIRRRLAQDARRAIRGLGMASGGKGLPGPGGFGSDVHGREFTRLEATPKKTAGPVTRRSVRLERTPRTGS